MTTYTEPKYLSDVLLVEVAQGWTKQTVMLAATTVALAIGTVLTKSAAGIFSPVNLAASNGTEVPHAVLAQAVNINAGQQKAVVIARGATVAKDQLVWSAGATSTQINTALAALESLGIVAQNTY